MKYIFRKNRGDISKMVAAVLKLDLYLLGDPSSLKEKRHILKHVKEKIKSRFDVSCVEVDFHDKWQRTVLGIAFINLKEMDARNLADRICDFIENDGNAEIYDKYSEFFII